jgi:hypothetical protein
MNNADAHPKAASISLLNQLSGTTQTANASVLIQAPATLTPSFGTTICANVFAPQKFAQKVKNGTTSLASASALSVAAQLVSTGTSQVAAVFASHRSAILTSSGTLIDASASVPSHFSDA